MLAGVIDPYTQFGGALINIERAHLEDGRALALIELLEVNEVLRQRMHVAHIARQPLDRGNGGSDTSLRRFELEQGSQGLFHIEGCQRAQALNTERLDNRTGFGCQPAFVTTKACHQRVPLAFGQLGFVTQQRFHHGRRRSSP